MTWLPLNPIPLKDRTSMIFLQYGQIDVYWTALSC